MKRIEIQEAIELEVNVLDENLVKPKTSDISYWFWNAVLKFVKTRYSGTNFRRESFEQTQKRIDDLRTLVTRVTTPLTGTTEEYMIALPADYMLTLGETAVIYSNDPCWPTKDGIPRTKHTDVTEATIENIDAKRENTFSMHRLHNNSAKPLRLYMDNKIYLYTDGNYYLSAYTLTYLRMPERIELTDSPFDEYTELPEHTHIELVKMAAQLYLENQANPRYESYTNEVATME